MECREGSQDQRKVGVGGCRRWDERKEGPAGIMVIRGQAAKSGSYLHLPTVPRYLGYLPQSKWRELIAALLSGCRCCK